MVAAVKKDQTIFARNFGEQFEGIKASAREYEEQSQTLLYGVLKQLFEFGEEIRRDQVAFEQFLETHNRSLNKVTKGNPYNALVDLAFSDKCRKSWRSEISNVLHFAAETKGNQPLVKWLESGRGISGRYDEAVKHFARTGTIRAQNLRSSRLEMITKTLKAARVVADELPGVMLGDGFHRSLLFSEAGKTFIVHIRDEDDQATIDKYLLEVAGNQHVPTHPLADHPLFPLYRAVDLIAGTCKPSNSGKTQIIVIWNETDDNRKVTRLRFISDAYSFTNSTVTLAHALPELDGKGQLLLELSDVDTFRQLFGHDPVWQISVEANDVFLIDNAKSQTRLRLQPIAKYAGHKLRQGRKLGRKTRHFQATCTGMQASLANLERATDLLRRAAGGRLVAHPTPKRLSLISQGSTLEAGFVDTSSYGALYYPFLNFVGPAAGLVAHRDLSLADISAFWETAGAYGEDLSGYIADGEEPDAAFCFDHTFHDGDRFEYVSPMVVSTAMNRTQVCEEFRPSDLPPPVPPSSGPGPSNPSGSPSKGKDQIGQSGSGKKARASSAKASGLSAQGVEPENAEDICPAVYNQKLQGYWRVRQKGVLWPDVEFKSKGVFGAFITSFLPKDPWQRECRQFDLEWQLRWWRRMTDISVTVVASGWTDAEIANHNELSRLGERAGRVIPVPGRVVSENRLHILREFYAGDHDWGIMMDDDATLYHGPDHNSGASFFSEMAANDPALYNGIDIFSPFTGKKPSPGQIWPNNPNLYARNHVFDPYHDLKGSMYVVRNFRKVGRPEILPPASYRLHGEDTLFAIEAISKGASVYRCDNIVLRELRAGGSAFPDRLPNMKIGNAEIARMYAHEGLKMGSKHLLDRKEMLRLKGRSLDKQITVAKP